MTRQTLPPGQLCVTITELALRDRNGPPLDGALPEGARIERALRPTVAFYRFLYETVGEPWLWYDRRRWSDADLAATVQDPAVEVWVLGLDGQPAGYAELDRRQKGEAELAYFGLMPHAIGRGLGPALLRFAIRRAWQAHASRILVHTCDFDHPSALGLYLRHGFVPFATHVHLIDDPRLIGLLPPRAAPHVPLAPGTWRGAL